MTHYDSSPEYQQDSADSSQAVSVPLSPCSQIAFVGAGNLDTEPEGSQPAADSQALFTEPLYPVSGAAVASPEQPAPSVCRRVPAVSVAALGPNAMLTVSQVAIELGVSSQRVRQLIAGGWLKAQKVNARLLLVRRKDLVAVAVRSSGRPCS